jgi:hypothetical protein
MKTQSPIVAGALLAVVLAAGAGGVFRTAAQEDPSWRQYADDYTEIENVLVDLYKTCTFGPGGEPDYDRMKVLFHPEVVFFQPPMRGSTAFRPMDLEGFFELWKHDIERSTMSETGFYETLSRHETTSFGRLAHSYVVFEGTQYPDTARRQRGVDSIDLVFHEGRWWVASIVTDFELPQQRIPDSILRGGGGEGE